MEKQPCVYIMGSSSLCFYIGVTSNLEQRIWQHKNKEVEGFSKNYNRMRLFYYEFGDDMMSAIEREKQLKKWSRAKKIKLISMNNPEFLDLSRDLGL